MLPPLVSSVTASPASGRRRRNAAWPMRVAVVADQPLAVPVEADPAEAPRVAEGVLVGQVGLLLGHRPTALLAQHPRAVRRDAAGQMQAGEREHVGGRRGDQAGRAERRAAAPDGRAALGLGAGSLDVADRGAVQQRLLGQGAGVRQAERGEEPLRAARRPRSRR